MTPFKNKRKWQVFFCPPKYTPEWDNILSRLEVTSIFDARRFGQPPKIQPKYKITKRLWLTFLEVGTIFLLYCQPSLILREKTQFPRVEHHEVPNTPSTNMDDLIGRSYFPGEPNSIHRQSEESSPRMLTSGLTF
jgi:hypothetical protein